MLPGRPLGYLIGLTATAVLAASWMAYGDYRTGLLRNRWTGPLAVAGLTQVVIVSASAPPWAAVAVPCLLGSAITTSLYLLLGLMGWVGFGDVKFAAGLALLVAIPAGWAGLYLLPLALTFSALPRLLRALAAKSQLARSAHGPALAAAFALLMIAGCISHG